MISIKVYVNYSHFLDMLGCFGHPWPEACDLLDG